MIGTDALADELAAAATARFLLNKTVIRLAPAQLAHLPPALAETLPHLPGLGESSVAVICKGSACLPPVREPERLFQLLQEESGSL